MARQRRCFFNISQQLVGREYKLGEVDCFAIVIQYLDLIGKKLPDVYRGIGIRNGGYRSIWLSEPVKAKKLMVGFIDENLPEVSRPRCGDIMLLKLKKHKSNIFLGIHGGNATVIGASEEHGVGVIGMDHYELIKAWSAR